MSRRWRPEQDLGVCYSECTLVCLQRRKLDAVYYYMRSLAASNPILTAKESLMSLFEETKRKVRRRERLGLSLYRTLTTGL